MKVAIFGRNFNDQFNTIIYSFLNKLSDKGVEIFIYQPFHDFLLHHKKFVFHFGGYFNSHRDLPKDIDFLISIGGDGTFLEAITIIRDSGIPLVGINSGRLGFLANIAGHEADHVIDDLLLQNYDLEERTLVAFSSEKPSFPDFPFALNECTIQKNGSSLITIQVTVNNEYLTSYWADGLIISTPTGSTAYSLSLGGPIVTPQSNTFIITPIAAHNLNVRPLVLPDNAVLSLTVKGRTETFLATLDSRSVVFPIETKISVIKASFSIRIIKLQHIGFYSTLRNKLMWGADRRN
jgi:NAD+ kinase